MIILRLVHLQVISCVKNKINNQANSDLDYMNQKNVNVFPVSRTWFGVTDSDSSKFDTPLVDIKKSGGYNAFFALWIPLCPKCFISDRDYFASKWKTQQKNDLEKNCVTGERDSEKKMKKENRDTGCERCSLDHRNSKVSPAYI